MVRSDKHEPAQCMVCLCISPVRAPDRDRSLARMGVPGPVDNVSDRQVQEEVPPLQIFDIPEDRRFVSFGKQDIPLEVIETDETQDSTFKEVLIQ